MGRDSRRFRKEIAANLQGLRTEQSLVADGAIASCERSNRWLRTEHTTVADGAYDGYGRSIRWLRTSKPKVTYCSTPYRVKALHLTE